MDVSTLHSPTDTLGFGALRLHSERSQPSSLQLSLNKLVAGLVIGDETVARQALRELQRLGSAAAAAVSRWALAQAQAQTCAFLSEL